MKDFIGLGALVIFLIICLLIAKKDRKESNDSYGIQKSFVMKAVIGIGILILIMIYKIIKDNV
ncbi:hypothetical protein [Flavobacterium phragmitis]|uniref:Uncharacterized protein n=1 Tax=Flavobacterium phragmitis TaxID=739143 RepID=A0A1I1X392_9FLAO|nr:hypothetical protein [Flavobacterium phragmitis]SFE01837.1 hypothetical protein SAMN05216297_11837 [Flavobacterium phragmitis]